MGIKKSPLGKKPDAEQIEKFIEGAEQKKETQAGRSGKKYPWEGTDPEVIKLFNLRLPKPLKLKLEYIAQRTPASIHGFIMEAVEKAVERELKKLEEK